MNKIKGLEDLAKYLKMNNLDESYEEGIDSFSENNITGGEKINIVMNRVFTNRFSPEYLTVLVNVFNRLTIENINSNKIRTLISELRVISKEMRINKEYPMEAILYGSKTINSILKNNDILIEELGDFIKEIFEISPVRNKEAMVYILRNWNWYPQLKIITNAIGKIGDKELVDELLLNTSNAIRYETFKALVNSGVKRYIKDILNMIALLNYEDNEDNKIAKYFRNFYIVNFREEGIDMAKEYAKLPNISRRGKNEINSIIPESETEVETIDLTIGDIKKVVENNDFNRIKKLLSNDKQRKATYIALRWARKDEETLKRYRILLSSSLKLNSRNESEIGEGIVTLAKLGGEDLKELAQNYLSKGIAREYSYGALAISGNPIYRDKLIEEIFSSNLKAYRVINQCKNKIEESLLFRINNNLNSNNSERIKEALRVSTELAGRAIFDFNVIIIRQIRTLLLSDKSALSDKLLRREIMKSIEIIFEEKTQEAITPLLFIVIEDSRSSIEEKSIAKRLLLSIGAELPR